jgi:HSP20 family protein
MANITKVDPFTDLFRFEPFRDAESLFPARLRRLFSEMPAEPTIKLDVSEDDKAYHVKAELPGVKKEDISVEIDGNQVSLSAEVRREKEEKKDEKVVHSERYYGKQFRSFTLARPIDRKAAAAKFTDGVLDLTLPKGGEAPNEKLTIQ